MAKCYESERGRLIVMRRVVGILLMVGAMLVVSVLPAGAIAEGDKSTDDRVGALFVTVLVPIGGGEFFADGPWIGCSGSQADEDVFLTAGHCLAWTQDLPEGFGVEWSVTFDDGPVFDVTPGPGFGLALPGVNLLTASGFAFDPGFGHDRANLKDYGVVLFDGQDRLPGPYVDLPYLGQLDDMKRNKELKGFVFDRAGYGTHPMFKQGPPSTWDDGYRYEAQSPYKSLNANWLRLHENTDKTGLGGGCYGDSGSPILGSTDSGHANVVFAVTTGGDPICRSDAFNQRLDTAEAQDFLDNYLTMPTAP